MKALVGTWDFIDWGWGLMTFDSDGTFSNKYDPDAEYTRHGQILLSITEPHVFNMTSRHTKDPNNYSIRIKDDKIHLDIFHTTHPEKVYATLTKCID